MNIWLNLIWKEWHEQKWKLLALTVIALSVCVAMLSQDVHSAEFALVSTMWAFVMLHQRSSQWESVRANMRAA